MSSGKRSIKDNACTESWPTMGDIPEGRFCGVCNTEVHDLTEKSLKEIESDYINKDVCVKMTEEQIAAFRYIHPIKRFAIAAFFTFGTSLFSISYGQEPVDSIAFHKANQCKVYGRFVFRKSTRQVIGKTIIIETETNKYSTETDQKGRYSIALPVASKIIKIDKEEVAVYIKNKKSINLGKKKLTISRFGSIGCPSF